jgi:hypothetical protein
VYSVNAECAQGRKEVLRIVVEYSCAHCRKVLVYVLSMSSAVRIVECQMSNESGVRIVGE